MQGSLHCRARDLATALGHAFSSIAKLADRTMANVLQSSLVTDITAGKHKASCFSDKYRRFLAEPLHLAAENLAGQD